MGEETPRATLSRGAQRPRDGGREATAQNGTQAGKAFFGALVENNAEEERAHARNDRCQRCSGACHWITAIFCVRMLRIVELYAFLQEDYAFFEEREKL